MELNLRLMDRDFVQAHLTLQGYLPGMSAHYVGIWHPEHGLIAAAVGKSADPYGEIRSPIKPQGWQEVEWDQIGNVTFWRVAQMTTR